MRQDSADESSPGNDTAQDNDITTRDLQNGGEYKGVPQENNAHNHFPDSHNSQTKESIGRRLPLASPVSDSRSKEDGSLPLPSEVSPKYSPDPREQTACPGQNFSGSREERYEMNSAFS